MFLESGQDERLKNLFKKIADAKVRLGGPTHRSRYCCQLFAHMKEVAQKVRLLPEHFPALQLDPLRAVARRVSVFLRRRTVASCSLSSVLTRTSACVAHWFMVEWSN